MMQFFSISLIPCDCFTVNYSVTVPMSSSAPFSTYFYLPLIANSFAGARVYMLGNINFYLVSIFLYMD